MVDYIPQDEYFEWEDILVCRQSEHIAQVMEMGSQILPSEYEESFVPTLSVMRKYDDADFRWDEAEVEAAQEQDITAVRSTSTLVSPTTILEPVEAASPITFPSYGDQVQENMPLQQQLQRCMQFTKDDSDAYLQPSRCVDYFSHQWRKEDMSASWRHIRAKEKLSKNAERLENASWRSWAKLCFSLKTVSPETIDWMKDLDDICLYGPFPASVLEEQGVTATSEISKPILKRPSISELLLQGSQLSWTGLRKRSTSSVATRKCSVKRSVKFNTIIEQCITIEVAPQKPLPKSKGALFRSHSNSSISSAPLVAQDKLNQDIKKPNFWSPPTSVQPQFNSINAPTDISQWTLLGHAEQEELDWISSPPMYSTTAYPPAPTSPSSIVRDVVAKSYIPKRRPESFPVYEQSSSDEDDEDEMMAQYLFDCDFKSDSDNLSPSDSSSSGEDHDDDDDVDFFDTGDLADEGRMMEKLHEIPMMERMKQSLFEQVVDEVSYSWE